METKTMTVHEALCRLKVIDKRVRSLKDSTFIGLARKSDTKIGGVPIEDVKRIFQSDYDKLMGVVAEADAIKAALSLSNAKTVIKVAGKDITIAEALYILDKGLPLKKEILSELKSQYGKAVQTAQKKNGEELDNKIENYISATFGSKEKVDNATLEDATAKYREMHTVELVDPANLKAEIDKLEAYIDAVESEIDSAIQVSNATTTIEITY